VQEKAPYQAKADKLKAEYAKKMDKYNNPQVTPLTKHRRQILYTGND
jgi:hypothetical protein